MLEAPHISKQLMEYLLRIYPERSPSIDDADRKIWVGVGEIKVVRHLASLYEEQQQDVLRRNK